MAVKEAGIRQSKADGRYRFLLSQYKQPSGCSVKSCKQLNNSQLEDILAICESHGWQMPGKPADYFRKKVESGTDSASFAQQEAIRYLAGDLGWDERNLAGFISKMTNERTLHVLSITPVEAWRIIEGLKAILSRKTGKKYNSLAQAKEDMEVSNAANQI